MTNTGTRCAATVVQLYASLQTPGYLHPAQQLIGFQRLELQPGEHVDVEFTVPMSMLSYAGTHLRPRLDNGTVNLAVGDSSRAIMSRTHIQITGGPAVFTPGQRAHLSTSKVSGAQG